ncbi:MAG: hypothetical protein CVU44_05790 [Chloroflexi bacterium HGW-Chloroflexi-6]|nr:MAG: hypothetical protein CVU44_05790 [Chloroflexi bacterium HGW-Chloroflexi-6]
MNKKAVLLSVLALTFAILACQVGGPSAQEVVETMIAETAAAASPTPTKTPVPPTATITPTLPPTETPTITPTATLVGPIVYTDDFSEHNKNWKGCVVCRWQDGALLMGPYKVNGEGTDQSHAAVCLPCGKKSYFRIAVDATFADGFTDRLYGLLVGDSKKYITYVGISPLQIAVLARGDYEKGYFDLLNASTENVFSKLVRPGKLVNHIEIIVSPAGAGTADFTMKINGTVSYVATNLPVEPSEVGLYLDWHSVGAAFDNFEFEEIIP